ncbi:response regulator transcription factor [Nitratifractor sp.]
MTKTVLLIEDDPQMRRLICDYLTEFGYDVEAFEDPREALDRFDRNPRAFDVVILDLMLPHMDGFDVCKKIKERHDVPIIISSARGDIGNKIHGFELGVDDYLAKPYEPRELILRIEAVLRRQGRSEKFQVGDLTIDPANREVTVEDFTVSLTPIEMDLLLYLLQKRGHAVSREQLIQAASLPPDTRNRTIDMHISNLRHKIGDDPKNPKYIRSQWGIGYKFIG